MTVAAVVALVLGSWLVFGSTAGSASTHGASAHRSGTLRAGTLRAGTAASVRRGAGHELGLSAPGSGSPQRTDAPSSSTTPSTAPPPTAPLSTVPPATTSPTPPTTSPTPPTTSAFAAVPGAVPVTFPAGIVTVPPSHRAARRRRAGATVLAPAGGTARAAAQLIRAIDQQTGTRGAIPETADNVELLGRWMDNEGGLWADNPLNTSLDAASYPHQFTASGQDTGIPIFPDLATGLVATAKTLLSNPSYSRILRVLGSGSASCMAFARVVIQSPWASGHYDYNPAGFCSGSITPVRRGRKPHHGG